MQTYPVRPGHAAKTDLASLFEAAFDSCKQEGEWLSGAYGSMPQIKARYDGKKSFVVDTLSDKGLALRMAKGDEKALQVATDTQRRWNDFLEGATGYDAKTRGKKIQELAKKST